MGGSDYYCALCGGPFGELYWNDQYEHYDADVLKNPLDPELEWLKENRLIGENRESSSLCKIWVSGPAHYQLHNFMEFEPGEDIEALPDEDAVPVYSIDDDFSLAIPFHERCRQVLGQYLGLPVAELDKEVLFQALEDLWHPEPITGRLDIDYGDIEKQMGQYWDVEAGTEHFVCNPVEVKGLQGYLKNLPKRSTGDIKRRQAYNTSGDPFSRLSTELLLLVTTCIDDSADIFELRQASPSFANLDLSQGFWRNRFRLDMPWLWDFSKQSAEELATMDWERVYHKMYWGSNPTSKKENKFYGLCNRRRIWEQICPDVAHAYWRSQKQLREESLSKPIIRKGAFEKDEVLLAVEDPYERTEIVEELLETFSDLAMAKPVLVLKWAEDELQGIQVVKDRERDQSKISEGQFTFMSKDIVPIPSNDWLTGFIFTSIRPRSDLGFAERKHVGVEVLLARGPSLQFGSNKGDKRLIRVAEGRFAVALRSVYYSEGILSRFSIIQQPLCHADGMPRVVDQHRDDYSPEIEEYLWKQELPKPSTKLTWLRNDLSNGGLAPVERLVFASTGEEMEDITGIAADVQLGGFQVHYGHRESRAIGPRCQAMKLLAIDGKGGERISQISVDTIIWDDETVAVRIETNWRRCMTVGQSRHPPSPLAVIDTDRKLSTRGLVASWSENMPSQPLWGVSPLGFEGVDCTGETKLPSPAKDSHGYVWEPSALPPGLKEVGTIWGQREVCESLAPLSTVMGEEPSPGCTVTWINCSRAISEVRVTLVHSTVTPEVPISALTFKYVDGEEETAGPTAFPMDPTCECGESSQSLKEELSAFPAHYRHEKWQVGGRRLTRLRLWRPYAQTISAIQLVAEGDLQSPVWSVWGHDPEKARVFEVDFADQRGARVDALKLFFQHNERTDGVRDTIIVGFQILRFV
ncbi:unnamed protein product [Clonostachys rosea]|uniref:F-box domain-containing protein n=1 Tax=Bionectria ochroleuca TaxID=29856 RepID=A0ABY6TRZ1_BIOOC|nr:unnamed protein product [Clonostachys rosea]